MVVKFNISYNFFYEAMAIENALISLWIDQFYFLKAHTLKRKLKGRKMLDNFDHTMTFIIFVAYLSIE